MLLRRKALGGVLEYAQRLRVKSLGGNKTGRTCYELALRRGPQLL